MERAPVVGSSARVGSSRPGSSDADGRARVLAMRPSWWVVGDEHGGHLESDPHRAEAARGQGWTVIGLFTQEQVEAGAQAAAARELARFTVTESDHWCTPGCGDGCDVARVRTWARSEVVARREPLTPQELAAVVARVRGPEGGATS